MSACRCKDHATCRQAPPVALSRVSRLNNEGADVAWSAPVRWIACVGLQRHVQERGDKISARWSKGFAGIVGGVKRDGVLRALLVAACVSLCAAAGLTAPVPSGSVRLAWEYDGCRVSTSHYVLRFDIMAPPLFRLFAPDGSRELLSFGGLWLEERGHLYVDSRGGPLAHFHVLRQGPYLVEIHVERMIPVHENRNTWNGSSELALCCHEDRIFVIASWLWPDERWINRGLYVYPVDHVFQLSPPGPGAQRDPLRLDACGFDLVFGEDARVESSQDLAVATTNGLALALGPTFPRACSVIGLAGNTVRFQVQPREDLQPGEVREIGGLVIVAPDGQAAREALEKETAPLPGEAFEMQMGEAGGYDPARGVYVITAQTAGTPEPPRGYRAGARFTIHNDGRPRRILIDQRDPWGGIGGGILRDGNGEPLPIVPQFALNFPELHEEAGEPGWAFMTYPLDLAANEAREIHAEHLYHALTDREIIYLTSLENVGDFPLLQTTVGRCESHTLTTGRRPPQLLSLPPLEIRVNDFRRIYSQIVVRSVSAILPTFFGFWDDRGRYHGLLPGEVALHETGPFLTEYTIGAYLETVRDGRYQRLGAGTLRVWQAPHSDMTRIFTELSLQITRDIPLDARRPAPVLFLRHHAFNPMAFMKYACVAADGSIKEDDLSYMRTIVENGTLLGEFPFACMFRASNPIDQGIPCSGISGNPGFVLLDWDVVIGGRPIRPALYVFCTGAGDTEDGDYARDLAIVPAERLRAIPAGSKIRYRAVQMVFGDNSTGPEVMAAERERWALRPLKVTAAVGQVISCDPPEVKAEGGRAEVELSGGADWVPLRVSGMMAGQKLRVVQEDAEGRRELGPGAPGEPWYSAWPDAASGYGFTFLVKVPPTGPVRLTIEQE